METSSREALDKAQNHGVSSGEQSAQLPPTRSAEAATTDATEALMSAEPQAPDQPAQVQAGQPDHQVLGNYVLLEKLGEGGMGVVYKAEHRRMKRLVALKVVAPHLATPAGMHRFHREVEALARLSHPNVVLAHDADQAGETHFLVMEYVAGQNLSQLVKHEGPLPVDHALRIIRQAAEGLAYAHAKGIVHRDIKPGNLLIDNQGTVKVLDLGLARQYEAPASAMELTGQGMVMGTIDYMAPEQAIDAHAADARADIYSLGATLWFLLTGKPLYEGASATARIIAHREAPIPSLRKVDCGATDRLDALLRRMVAKQPAERFASMQELLQAIDNCMADYMQSTVAFAPQPAAVPHRKRLTRRQSLTIGAAALSGGVTFWNLRRPTPPKSENETQKVPEQPSSSSSPNPPVGDWLDVLAHIDPQRDRVHIAGRTGKNLWTRQDGELLYTGDDRAGKLVYPLKIDGDAYDYEVAFTRTSGNMFLNLDLPSVAGVAPIMIDCQQGKVIAGYAQFHMANCKIETGVRLNLTLRKLVVGSLDRLEFHRDNQLQGVWQGNWHTLVWPAVDEVPTPNQAGIYVHAGSSFTFHQIRWRMHHGTAKLS